MYLDLEKRTNKKTGKVSKAIWSLERIEKNWLKYLDTAPRLKKAYENDMKVAYPWELKDMIQTFYYFQLAIFKGGIVDCRCVKSPPGNLDTGRHYYEIVIYYITPDRKIAKRFVNFPKSLAREIGFYDVSGTNGFTFGSGAIGMSRKLAATDWYATILKEVVGIYCQWS